MKLSTFAKAVNKYIEAGHGTDKVVVELDNVAEGSPPEEDISADVLIARPSKNRKAIVIQTETPVISKEKDRDRPKFAEEKTDEPEEANEKKATKKRTVFVCPDCGFVIRKTDRFCAQCGRKIVFREKK